MDHAATHRALHSRPPLQSTSSQELLVHAAGWPYGLPVEHVSFMLDNVDLDGGWCLRGSVILRVEARGWRGIL